ncbi:FadR/GntR family transcriptional regulator [uncultured Ruthenibacterium sp.]|uniref:FadR/GntR family transcriptional regulator n=1 Tax=uncultured Ruthenibacterium sp. TaxID=1905347 RepID=UPI00349EBDD0
MALKENELNRQIAELITEHLRTGEKLPPEKELTARFGVSRTALRDALNAYEAQGILTSVQGSGRTVKMLNLTDQIINTWGIVLEAKPDILFDILELRTSMEMAALPRMAERIDTEQLQFMGAQVERMKEKAKRGETFMEEDRAFHMTMFHNAGNVLTEQLLIALWSLLNTQIATRHPDLMVVACQHEDLIKALARQDLAGLQQVTKEQLADVRYRVINYMVQKSRL